MSDATIIRACDILSQALQGGSSPLSDDDILADCQTCKQAIELSLCRLSQLMETTYSCPKCGSTLIIISAPNRDGKPWPGRGYRLKDFVLRNAVDLLIRGAIKIPRSPRALD
jgi:predicted RNA-binding Zn-ribbon protein involved in translation (DUF1610 family)